MTTATSELGRELQLVHAAQWLYTANEEPFVPGAGDAYARFARGFDEDTVPVLAAIAARGPLWRSRLDIWVGADRETTERLLGHPDTAVAAAVPQVARWLPDPERQHTRALVRDLAHRIGGGALRASAGRLRDEAERAVARLEPGAVDLVADFVAPLTAAVYAGLLDVRDEQRAQFAAALSDVSPAVDALLCPQTLAVTRRLESGLLVLRELFNGRRYAEADLILAVAGARAAADLLGNVVAAFLDRPQEWDRLRTDQAHVERSVAAVLRTAPLWQAYPLVALAPVELAGARIEAGENVTAVTGPGVGPEGAVEAGSAGPASPYERLFLGAARAQAVQAVTSLAARFVRMCPEGGTVRARRAPLTRRQVRLSARLGE